MLSFELHTSLSVQVHAYSIVVFFKFFTEASQS